MTSLNYRGRYIDKNKQSLIALFTFSGIIILIIIIIIIVIVFQKNKPQNLQERDHKQ